MRSLRALMVEDDQRDTDLLLLELKRAGYEVEWVRVMTAEAMEAELATGRWQIVFSDYSMPNFSALGALEVHRKSRLDLPFVIISGTIGEETAVEALKAGAHDFLVKGQLARLARAVERELREYEIRAAVRRGEEALRRSEARFRTLLEGMADLVIVHRDLVIAYANPRAAECLGFSAPSELVGLRVSDFVHADDRPAAIERARRAATEVVRTPGDARWVGRDGKDLWLQVIAQPVEVDAQPSVMVVARDVSEQRKLESQLLISDRMASVGMLAAGVAHEINNPLAVVVAALPFVQDELRARGVNDADLHAALEEASEAADRVRQIVLDLKVFSRSSEPERREHCDLAAILDSSARMALNEIRHRARLVRDFAPVPDVLANEPRLGQVFLNLLVNAAQSLPEGHSGAHEIRLSTFVRPDGRVGAEVRDTGPGMSPEVLRKLFTPFFTTKPVGVGTGLGLSICHRIVTSMDGEIEVESALGKGTAFRVLLPRATDGAPQRTVAPAPIVTSSRAARVLVVDDEVLIGRTVQRALKSQHDVTAVTSAAEALELLAKGEQYDLILCDLMMPHMTGIDFHAELETRYPRLIERLVFLSGGVFTRAAMEFLEKVSRPRLDKPFDVGRLAELVNAHVGGKGSRT